MKFIKIIFVIILILVVANLIKMTISASDCLDALPGGDLTLTTPCSFSGTVNGVDNGINATNSAVLTIGTGGTLTILPGQTIAVGSLSIKGGSVVKMLGGTLKTKTPLWMVDEDSDGYPATTTQYAQTTQPIGARRRNTLTTMVSVDQNDSYYCPNLHNPNVTCNECKNGGLSNQPDGVDNFSQCSQFYLCNGVGACSLHAKRVFVTSTSSTGNLGGLIGADQICQNLADSTSLNGTWKAWLSDSVTSVSNRFTHSSIYPYILVDETTKIADNWSNLTSATLAANINMTEAKTVDLKAKVWTNSNSDGTIVSTDPGLVCDDWSNVKKTTAIYGKNNFTTSQWTNFDSVLCNKPMSLYCFEQ